jgi:hypothetical protein
MQHPIVKPAIHGSTLQEPEIKELVTVVSDFGNFIKLPPS